MTTITVLSMTTTEIRNARDEAVLGVLRTIGKPATVRGIMDALPEVPCQAWTGTVTLRRPGRYAVCACLQRLTAHGKVKASVNTETGIAYLYEVAA